jgi:hypothetical protein
VNKNQWKGISHWEDLRVHLASRGTMENKARNGEESRQIKRRGQIGSYYSEIENRTIDLRRDNCPPVIIFSPVY